MVAMLISFNKEKTKQTSSMGSCTRLVISMLGPSPDGSGHTKCGPLCRGGPIAWTHLRTELKSTGGSDRPHQGPCV